MVASFPPDKRTLRVDVFDPEPGEPEPVSIDVDADRYMLAYYEPFLAAMEVGVPDLATERGVGGEVEIEVARLESVGIRVGLLADIAVLVRRAREAETSGLADSVVQVLDRPTNQSVFADGTLVETDWDIALATEDRDTGALEDRYF